MSQRYLTSKLLEVYTCREIAKDHPVEQLKVGLNFVNPGWCHSDLIRDEKNIIMRIFMRLMCRTTEVGSRTLVHAGLVGPQTHGKYLSDCKPTPCAPFVEGPEGPATQRRVWNELAAKLEQIQPGILKVLDA